MISLIVSGDSSKMRLAELIFCCAYIIVDTVRTGCGESQLCEHNVFSKNIELLSITGDRGVAGARGVAELKLYLLIVFAV